MIPFDDGQTPPNNKEVKGGGGEIRGRIIRNMYSYQNNLGTCQIHQKDARMGAKERG